MGAELTRRELVLQLLQRHIGEWVDGTRIASAEVGGSEGLKRLRELRQEGLDIRMRKHPDPRRDIYQYRLVRPVDHHDPRPPAAAPPVMPAPLPVSPGVAGRNFPLVRNEDGSIEVSWQVCDDCGGRYAIEVDHLSGEEHQRWLQSHDTIDGQTEIPTPPQPPVYRFTEMPKPSEMAFGDVLVCPRCRGVRRKAYTDGHGNHHPAETECMDPKNRKITCQRCNGYGLVPNIGPVETAKQEPLNG